MLNGVKEKSRLTVSNCNIICAIASLKILVAAYELVKKCPMNSTLEIGGIDLKYLKNLSAELRAGKFAFYLAKKKSMPIVGKEELRLLEISNFRDQIVQSALLLVLVAVYEKKNLNCSYGFGLSKSRHTALKSLKLNFAGCTSVIVGDVSKCYDVVNHDFLVNIIKEKIRCDKTIVLIKNFLKNPYQERGSIVYPKIGLFQGSSLNDIFCNILLDKFDNFIFALKDLSNQEKYLGGSLKLREVLSSHYSSLPFFEKNFITEFQHFLHGNLFFGLLFRSLQYVRYVDGFVIGIAGSLEDASTIKAVTVDFFQKYLLLPISVCKVRTFDFNTMGCVFLGTFIKRIIKDEKQLKVNRRSGERLKARKIPRVLLKAPILMLLKKASEFGFFKKTSGGKFVPTAYRAIIDLEHSTIISFYNSKIRRIFSYYSFVCNRKSLKVLMHGLKHSCALTLALKFKLRFRSKVFKKFGNRLRCCETGAELCILKT